MATIFMIASAMINDSLCNDQVIRVHIKAGVNQVIDTMPVGAKPWASAINPEGTRLYVGDVVNPTQAPIPNGKIWVVEISNGAF